MVVSLFSLPGWVFAFAPLSRVAAVELLAHIGYFVYRAGSYEHSCNPDVPADAIACSAALCKPLFFLLKSV